MYRKTSDYLTYLIALASVVAPGVANAMHATEQQRTLMKLDNIKHAGGWFQRQTWVNEAFPKSTGFTNVRLPPPFRSDVGAGAGRAPAGAMKKKLKSIQGGSD